MEKYDAKVPANNGEATKELVTKVNREDNNEEREFGMGSWEGMKDVYAFREIGVCESVFANKRGVPRQGNLAPDTLGRIVLHKHMSGTALEGLETFSHVWIVFVFSRNTNKDKVAAWVRGDSQVVLPSKIRPPLLQGKSTGLLSTRSPHRPNPIGLTLAELRSIDVQRREVVVAGIDLCHLTPVLDIKPFVPGDVPLATPKFASWVLAEKNIDWEVEFCARAEEDCEAMVTQGVTQFYRTSAELKEAIAQVIRLDVRAVHQGRQGSRSRSSEPVRSVSQQCVIDRVQVLFSVNDSTHTASILAAQRYDVSVDELAAGKKLKYSRDDTAAP